MEKLTIYLYLHKALYGTLRAAILFWENLTSTLTAMGFEVKNMTYALQTKSSTDRNVQLPGM